MVQRSATWIASLALAMTGRVLVFTSSHFTGRLMDCSQRSLGRHCEERGDEAIHGSAICDMDCFAGARNDGESSGAYFVALYRSLDGLFSAFTGPSLRGARRRSNPWFSDLRHGLLRWRSQ